MIEILSAIARGLQRQAASVPYRTLPQEMFCVQEECYRVEVARTPAEKSLGLMYRTRLPERYGMLFERDDEQSRSFWMRNTRIPLHMYFLDAQKNIVDQTTMSPCRADPCPSYTSRYPAKYVLELMVRD